MANVCGDNRFELIFEAKQKLMECTNIADSPEEMTVIDNILFRFWQMGWLPQQNKPDLTINDVKMIVEIADNRLERYDKKELLRGGPELYYSCVLGDFNRRKSELAQTCIKEE